MSLPDTITIGPYRWLVSTDAAALANLRREEGSKGQVGEADFHTLRILVDNTCQADLIAETLLHEVLHAVWDQVLGDVKASPETAIRALSPLLLDVLRRNPALVAALVTVEG